MLNLIKQQMLNLEKYSSNPLGLFLSSMNNLFPFLFFFLFFMKSFSPLQPILSLIHLLAHNIYTSNKENLWPTTFLVCAYFAGRTTSLYHGFTHCHGSIKVCFSIIPCWFILIFIPSIDVSCNPKPHLPQRNHYLD